MIKKILRLFAVPILCTIAVSVAINIYTVGYAAAFVYDSLEDIKKDQRLRSDKKTYTALVLGAMVHGTQLSPVLQDRVDAGIACCKDGFCTALLLSGDHGKKWYDEVSAMHLYVQQKHPEIDKERIFLDHAGFNTYDSVYRAKEVFHAQDVIVITQRFHSYRAVYIGRKLGLNICALALNEDKYADRLRCAWAGREYLARVKAFADTAIQRKPLFLGKPVAASATE